MARKNKQRQFVDKTLNLFGAVTAVVLVAVGVAALAAHSFIDSNVRDELSSQKIFFPPKGSAAISALPAEDQAQMNKYAGQQLVSGDQAKVYADNFMAVHLKEIAGGKTYAEVSTAALADPTNATLQNQVNLLFRGETLRGLLLGDAYAFWTVGNIAQTVAIVAFAGAAVMGLLVLLGLRHLALVS